MIEVLSFELGVAKVSPWSSGPELEFSLKFDLPMGPNPVDLGAEECSGSGGQRGLMGCL